MFIPAPISASADAEQKLLCDQEKYNAAPVMGAAFLGEAGMRSVMRPFRETPLRFSMGEDICLATAIRN